jgi:hypothetical protein
MVEEGRIGESEVAQLGLLLSAMLLIVVFVAPIAEGALIGRIPRAWQWNMPQTDAWNPYDCRFWQELPPAETMDC